MALLALALHSALPRQAATTAIPYTQVLRSTLRLVRVHPALLRRGLYQAAMFGAFSAFWTTVSYVLTGPRFHYSPSASVSSPSSERPVRPWPPSRAVGPTESWCAR